MSEYSVSIDHEGFRICGTSVIFDEEKYAGLIRTLKDNADCQGPSLAIFPHHLVRAGHEVGRLRLLLKLLNPLDSDRFDGGGYNDKTGGIDVAVVNFTTEEASAFLLHEAWHWADDRVLGLPTATHHKYKKPALVATMGASVVAGFSVAEFSTSIPAGLAAGAAILVGGTLAVSRMTYGNDPSEVRASQFERDPEIIRQFGNIITFASLD